MTIFIPDALWCFLFYIFMANRTVLLTCVSSQNVFLSIVSVRCCHKHVLKAVDPKDCFTLLLHLFILVFFDIKTEINT